MKRYRILAFEFDTRATVLSTEILESWADDVKQTWINNKEIIAKQLIEEYGQKDSNDVIKNFVELGPKPFSIISSYNLFHEHARHSFIVGAYYASVTAVCALGERMLNYLVINLRDEFKEFEVHSDIRTHKSLSNWKIMNEALLLWNIFDVNVFNEFNELLKIRNRVIHYNKNIEEDLKGIALRSLKIMANIITMQYSSYRNEKYFIQEMFAETYLKKEYEAHPFVKLIYVPNSLKVSPFHFVTSVKNGYFEIDHGIEIEDKDVSDIEFINLRNKFQGKAL
jgi:hypothetical protein